MTLAPHPDARQDLAGALNYIMDNIDVILRTREEKRISAAAAAKALGLGNGYLHNRPWRIPGFGAQGYMHSLSAWRAWLQRPEAVRRSEWDAIPIDERAAIRGQVRAGAK